MDADPLHFMKHMNNEVLQPMFPVVYTVYVYVMCLGCSHIQGLSPRERNRLSATQKKIVLVEVHMIHHDRAKPINKSS